jgi:hypothetical protein
MKQEFVDSLKERALATYLRTDGSQADIAEVVEFEDLRWGGRYVILRTAGEAVAVYKMVVRFGAAKPDGKGAFVVNSMSVGVKRIKRWPKGLVSKEREA